MIPQMTNEQFALWIAATKGYNPSDMKKIADDYYEWLESKKPKPTEIKHYLNGVELPEPIVREQELIKKILDDRSNANGHDSNGNPKYIYEGYEYILNESCNKILAMSFEKIK